MFDYKNETKIWEKSISVSSVLFQIYATLLVFEIWFKA